VSDGDLDGLLLLGFSGFSSTLFFSSLSQARVLARRTTADSEMPHGLLRWLGCGECGDIPQGGTWIALAFCLNVQVLNPNLSQGFSGCSGEVVQQGRCEPTGQMRRFSYTHDIILMIFLLAFYLCQTRDLPTERPSPDPGIAHRICWVSPFFSIQIVPRRPLPAASKERERERDILRRPIPCETPVLAHNQTRIAAV
jgi:hypothetical protein